MSGLTDDEPAFLQSALDLARDGRTAELTELLDAGLSVNVTSDRGDSLLVLAAEHDRCDTLEALLARGADTERVNDRGHTALGAAVLRRSEHSVRALLAAGADPDGGTRTARQIAGVVELRQMSALLPDAAASDALERSLGRVAASLHAFTRFLGPDDAVTSRDRWLPVLDRALPADGAGLDVVLDELELAVRYGCRIGAPGFNGFITTAGTTATTAAALGSHVAGAQRYLLHSFNALEHVGLRWLAEVCGLPASWQGVFTSGGSTANLVALAAARQAAYERLGIDVAADGLAGAPTGRIYVSTEAHRTIHRSAAALGLGRQAVVEVPTDDRQRIDVRALEATLAADRRAGVVPVAVVAVAGTTNTGALDPLSDVVSVARHHDAWVHVDGAYGLLAACVPRLAPLLAAAADADSAIVDPHKWMATGVGVGATFVRDASVLHRALAEGESPYLEGALSLDAGAAVSPFESLGAPWADLGVELSAPSRGAQVWAALRETGVRGLADRIDRHCGFAAHLADRARRHPRLELLTEPQLSICCFRYADPAVAGADLDAVNRRVVQRLLRETPFAPSTTVVAGRLAIRPCYVNPRTTLADVDGLADAVVRLGDEERARS